MTLFLFAAAMMAAQSAEAPAQAMPDAEEPKAEKMICKRETVTGSLSQRKRTCMTQREWDRLRLNTKDSVQDYIDRAVSVPAVTPG